MGGLVKWSSWLSMWLPWRRPQPSLGKRGEAAAERFLVRRGCKMLARGEREKIGELDLVALDGEVIVFVEVKTRQSAEMGHPAEAVTTDKQRRITRAALSWLKRHGLLEYAARFDVIAVTWPENTRHPTIEHFPNAFEAQGAAGFYS